MQAYNCACPLIFTVVSGTTPSGKFSQYSIQLESVFNYSYAVAKTTLMDCNYMKYFYVCLISMLSTVQQIIQVYTCNDMFNQPLDRLIILLYCTIFDCFVVQLWIKCTMTETWNIEHSCANDATSHTAYIPNTTCWWLGVLYFVTKH